MNACILYFSQTGNTQKFAETISDSLKIPAVYDITTTAPSVVNDYDVILLGTPVHGFSPSKESLAFVERLPEGNGKTSYKACHGRKPAVSYLRVFGCLMFTKEFGHIDKLNDRIDEIQMSEEENNGNDVVDESFAVENDFVNFNEYIPLNDVSCSV